MLWLTSARIGGLYERVLHEESIYFAVYVQ